MGAWHSFWLFLFVQWALETACVMDWYHWNSAIGTLRIVQWALKFLSIYWSIPTKILPFMHGITTGYQPNHSFYYSWHSIFNLNSSSESAGVWTQMSGTKTAMLTIEQHSNLEIFKLSSVGLHRIYYKSDIFYTVPIICVRLTNSLALKSHKPLVEI